MRADTMIHSSPAEYLADTTRATPFSVPSEGSATVRLDRVAGTVLAGSEEGSGRAYRRGAAVLPSWWMAIMIPAASAAASSTHASARAARAETGRGPAEIKSTGGGFT